MKLTETIEIVELSCNHSVIVLDQDRLEAIKLLIEAGKRLAFNRLNTIASSDELLPGETK